MARTYLQLVNDAIIESGTDLDEISSGSFSSTTNSMQVKWKRWVKQAWLDIQTERRNWHFMRKDGVYIVKPRISFYDGTAPTYATAFDNQAIADTNSNWAATVNGSVVVESGALSAGTAAGYFSYKDADETYPIIQPVKPTDLVYVDASTVELTHFNDRGSTFEEAFVAGASLYLTSVTGTVGTVLASEDLGGSYKITMRLIGITLTDFVAALVYGDALKVQQVAPRASLTTYVTHTTDSTTNYFRVGGYGRYSFADQTDSADSLLTDIQEVDLRSVKISPYVGAVEVDYSTTGYTPLQYIPYEHWKHMRWDRSTRSLGQPSYFTVAPDGKYEFNCAVEKEYAVSFTYWKTPQTLVAHDDEIEGISDFYAEAIVWKAVQYWADFDEQPGAANKALKRFTAAYRKLLRDYSDEIKFPYGVGEASVIR